jgi:hypothetical protein
MTSRSAISDRGEGHLHHVGDRYPRRPRVAGHAQILGDPRRCINQAGRGPSRPRSGPLPSTTARRRCRAHWPPPSPLHCRRPAGAGAVAAPSRRRCKRTAATRWSRRQAAAEEIRRRRAARTLPDGVRGGGGGRTRRDGSWRRRGRRPGVARCGRTGSGVRSGKTYMRETDSKAISPVSKHRWICLGDLANVRDVAACWYIVIGGTCFFVETRKRHKY